MSALIDPIPPPPFQAFELGPLTVHVYGVLIALGALLGLWLTRRRWRAGGGDPELADRTVLAALVAGVVGARLAWVAGRLVTDPGHFSGRWWQVVAIWEGGLAIYGGLALGLLAAWLVTRRAGASFPAFADAAVPGAALAQAIGRWGNYFNQELYGQPTDVPWALHVEPAFRRPGFEANETFHPTFLYESLWLVLLTVVLLLLSRHARLRTGTLLLVYLAGHGLGRALIELLRIDTDMRLLGLSRNNWVAIALVAVVVTILLVRWLRARRGEPDDGDEDAGRAGADDAPGGADDAPPSGSDAGPSAGDGGDGADERPGG